MNLSPVYHGIAVAFHIPGNILAWGAVVSAFVQLVVLVVD